MRQILMVNGAELIPALQKSFLKRAGCAVITASSGPEALEKARAARPDLIVLDAGVPDDALGCCRTIKADAVLKTTPVVLVASPGAYARCTAAGSDAFLAAPATRERLLEVVTKFVPVAERDWPRREVALDVRFSHDRATGRGRMRNLCVDGLFLETRDELPDGDVLDVGFDLPGRPALAVRARARVLRSVAGSGMAVQFRGMSARDRLAIERFVRNGEGA